MANIEDDWEDIMQTLNDLDVDFIESDSIPKCLTNLSKIIVKSQKTQLVMGRQMHTMLHDTLKQPQLPELDELKITVQNVKDVADWVQQIHTLSLEVKIHRNAYESLHSQLFEVQDQLQEKDQECRKLHVEHAALQRQMQDRQQWYNQAQEKLLEYEEQLKDQRGELSQLRKKLSADEISTMLKDIPSLGNIRGSLDGVSSDMDGHLVELSANNHQCPHDVNKVVKKAAALIKRVSDEKDAEMAVLKEQLERAENNSRKLSADGDQAIHELRKSLERALNDAETYKNQDKESQIKLVSAFTEIEKLHSEKAKLETQLVSSSQEDLKKQYQELRNMVARCLNMDASLLLSPQSFQAAVVPSLECLLQEQARSTSVGNVEIASSSAQAEVDALHSFTAQEYERLRVVQTTQQEEIRRMQQQCEALTLQNSQLQAQLDSLSKSNTESSRPSPHRQEKTQEKAQNAPTSTSSKLEDAEGSTNLHVWMAKCDALQAELETVRTQLESFLAASRLSCEDSLREIESSESDSVFALLSVLKTHAALQTCSDAQAGMGRVRFLSSMVEQLMQRALNGSVEQASVVNNPTYEQDAPVSTSYDQQRHSMNNGYVPCNTAAPAVAREVANGIGHVADVTEDLLYTGGAWWELPPAPDVPKFDYDFLKSLPSSTTS